MASMTPLPKVTRTGRNSFILGAALISIYTGFYFVLDRRDKKRMAEGRLTGHEYAIARGHANIAPSFPSPSSTRSTSASANPPKTPTHTHDAHHIPRDHPSLMQAVESALGMDPNSKSSEMGEGTTAAKTSRRFEVPTPQRARGDGSGMVYTKSPEFAQSYGKVKGGRFREKGSGEGDEESSMH